MQYSSDWVFPDVQPPNPPLYSPTTTQSPSEKSQNKSEGWDFGAAAADLAPDAGGVAPEAGGLPLASPWYQPNHTRLNLSSSFEEESEVGSDLPQDWKIKPDFPILRKYWSYISNQVLIDRQESKELQLSAQSQNPTLHQSQKKYKTPTTQEKKTYIDKLVLANNGASYLCHEAIQCAMELEPSLQQFEIRTIRRWYKKRNLKKKTGFAVINAELNNFFVRAARYLLNLNGFQNHYYKVVGVIQRMLINSQEHQSWLFPREKDAVGKILKIKPEAKVKYIKKNLYNPDLGEPLTLEEKLLLSEAAG